MSFHISEHSLSCVLTRDLSAGTYKARVEEIRPHYLWFAPSATDEDIRARLYRHPESRLGIVRDTEGKCVGFTSYHIETVASLRVMFRGGTVIRERSRGLYKAVIAHALMEHPCDYLAAMTQNPRVYETLRSFSPRRIAYPHAECGEERWPSAVVRIAAHFCIAPHFERTTLRMNGIYAGIRKDSDFKTGRDSAVAELFSRLGEDDGYFVAVPLS